MKQEHYKDDLKAILHLTATTFTDEVIHLAKDEPEAKKIFLEVENTYAKFVETQIESELKKLGYYLGTQEMLIKFLEKKCNIKRDETLSNPLNALYLGDKLVCSWYDFADVIGRVSKN